MTLVVDFVCLSASFSAFSKVSNCLAMSPVNKYFRANFLKANSDVPWPLIHSPTGPLLLGLCLRIALSYQFGCRLSSNCQQLIQLVPQSGIEWKWD